MPRPESSRADGEGVAARLARAPGAVPSLQMGTRASCGASCAVGTTTWVCSLSLAGCRAHANKPSHYHITVYMASQPHTLRCSPPDWSHAAARVAAVPACMPPPDSAPASACLLVHTAACTNHCTPAALLAPSRPTPAGPTLLTLGTAASGWGAAPRSRPSRRGCGGARHAYMGPLPAACSGRQGCSCHGVPHLGLERAALSRRPPHILLPAPLVVAPSSTLPS